MSSLSESLDTIAWFNHVNIQVNRYFPLPFVVLGTTGVVLNLIIFTRRSLFLNPCTHYLLGNTVANFFVLYWVTISRMFSDGYRMDISVTSDSFCKVRYFITYVSRTLSTWFIVLACIDRWISSIRVQRRQQNLLLARVIISVTTVICILSFCHVLIYFGVQKTSTSTTCYAHTGSYRIFSDLQYLVFYALGPPLVMLAFGLATLHNYRRTRRQVLSNTSSLANNKNRIRRDGQLLIMLLMQVALIIIFTVPFAGEKLYEAFSTNANKSSLQIAQENLIATIFRILSYGSHAFGFFVYTLSARIFRVELFKILNIIYRQVTGRNLNPALTAGITMIQMQSVDTYNAH